MGGLGHDFPSLKPKGPWSVANAYGAKDLVSFGGGSYVAINNVPPGGAPPVSDVANWMVLARGGEVAYASYQGIWNLLTAGTINTLIDIPGCSIVVPAHSGRLKLEARCGAIQIAGGATAVAGESNTVKLQITDTGVAAPGTLAQGIWRHVHTRASENRFQPIAAEAVVPDAAVDKTYKLQLTCDTTNSGHTTAVNVWAADGGGNNNPGPTYIRAVAA